MKTKSGKNKIKPQVDWEKREMMMFYFNCFLDDTDMTLTHKHSTNNCFVFCSNNPTRRRSHLSTRTIPTDTWHSTLTPSRWTVWSAKTCTALSMKSTVRPHHQPLRRKRRRPCDWLSCPFPAHQMFSSILVFPLVLFFFLSFKAFLKTSEQVFLPF